MNNEPKVFDITGCGDTEYDIRNNPRFIKLCEENEKQGLILEKIDIVNSNITMSSPNNSKEPASINIKFARAIFREKKQQQN